MAARERKERKGMRATSTFERVTPKQNYADFLHADYGHSFAEWLGCKRVLEMHSHWSKWDYRYTSPTVKGEWCPTKKEALASYRAKRAELQRARPEKQWSVELSERLLKSFPRPCRPRKPHRCILCWEGIQAGEECCSWSCLTDGEGFRSFHAHPECYQEVIDARWDSCDWEEHVPGEFARPKRQAELAGQVGGLTPAVRLEA